MIERTVNVLVLLIAGILIAWLLLRFRIGIASILFLDVAVVLLDLHKIYLVVL